MRPLASPAFRHRAKRLSPRGGLAVTALCAAVLCAGCHDSHAAHDSGPEARVRVTQVTAGRLGERRYTGSVHARIESELGFRVGGLIFARLVDPGMHVHKGEALMRLDTKNLDLAAHAAEQKLTAARAEASRAAAEESRQRGLRADGAISAASYEAALAAARSGAANAAAAEAAARDATLDLSYATLAADADGVVLELLAQPGQVVAPGAPVLRLARDGAREAAVGIPESQLATVPQEALAQIYGADGTVRAKLREVAGAADPATRTFAARYVLDMPATGAPLGATVTLSVLSPASDALEVPLGALHDAGLGPGVWRLTPAGTVQFAPVKLMGLTDESAIVSSAALHPGVRIVAIGAQQLREGERVEIGEPPT